MSFANKSQIDILFCLDSDYRWRLTTSLCVSLPLWFPQPAFFMMRNLFQFCFWTIMSDTHIPKFSDPSAIPLITTRIIWPIQQESRWQLEVFKTTGTSQCCPHASHIELLGTFQLTLHTTRPLYHDDNSLSIQRYVMGRAIHPHCSTFGCDDQLWCRP